MIIYPFMRIEGPKSIPERNDLLDSIIQAGATGIREAIAGIPLTTTLILSHQLDPNIKLVSPDMQEIMSDAERVKYFAQSGTALNVGLASGLLVLYDRARNDKPVKSVGEFAVRTFQDACVVSYPHAFINLLTNLQYYPNMYLSPSNALNGLIVFVGGTRTALAFGRQIMSPVFTGINRIRNRHLEIQEHREERRVRSKAIRESKDVVGLPQALADFRSALSAYEWEQAEFTAQARSQGIPSRSQTYEPKDTSKIKRVKEKLPDEPDVPWFMGVRAKANYFYLLFQKRQEDRKRQLALLK